MKLRASLVLALVTGCASAPGWKPLPPPPSTFAEEQPEEVRVTLTNGSQVRLTSPHLAGDTLLGWSDPITGHDLVRIPVVQVRAIEQWRGPAGRSAERLSGEGGGFAAGGILIFLGILMVGSTLVLVGCGLSNGHCY